MDEKFKEFLKPFVDWIKVKTRIHIKEDVFLNFKVRQIWWANVGLNVGSEQNGKHENFERPVLVLRKFGQGLFWAVPLTSKNKNNIYRLEFNYKSYFENIEGEWIPEDKKGILVLNQLKAMSSKRLIRKIGVVPESEFEIVRDKIREIV